MRSVSSSTVLMNPRVLNTVLEHLDCTIAGYSPGLYPWDTREEENFTIHAVLSNLTRFISNRFETDTISEQGRLSSLQRIFETTKPVTADDLHDPQSQVEVVGKPLDMIRLLVDWPPNGLHSVRNGIDRAGVL